MAMAKGCGQNDSFGSAGGGMRKITFLLFLLLLFT